MNNKEEKKLTLKEKLKDKRERAKLELMAYGIFFIGVIIFARVLGSATPNIENNNENNNNISKSFIESLNDNYEYDIQIIINEDKSEYYGKVLGNNATINLIENDKTKSYYKMNTKYYLLQNENFILTDIEEVYPYIDYNYINIKNIKEYISLGTKENDIYKTKIKDIVLNNESEDYITITIEEGDKNIIIDYTPLLKITKENINKAIVNITYNNINNITSLEE